MSNQQCPACGAVSENYCPVVHREGCPEQKKMDDFAKKFGTWKDLEGEY